LAVQRGQGQRLRFAVQGAAGSAGVKTGGDDRAAFVLDRCHLIVSPVAGVDGLIQRVLLAADVAAGVRGAGQGFIQTVAVLGGIAQRVILFTADAVALIVKAQNRVVRLGQFGHATVGIVVIGANVATRVGDAGGFAVEVVVQGFGVVQGIMVIKDPAVLVVIEGGFDRLAGARQRLGDFVQQMAAIRVAVDLIERIGDRLQIARSIVGVLPFSSAPVGNVFDMAAAGVVGNRQAGSAGNA